ncbi:MAG: hypothetical protein WDA07_15185, partial [Leucobacter sp.]
MPSLFFAGTKGNNARSEVYLCGLRLLAERISDSSGRGAYGSSAAHCLQLSKSRLGAPGQMHFTALFAGQPAGGQSAPREEEFIMNILKKALTVVLALTVAATLASCGNASAKPEPSE